MKKLLALVLALVMTLSLAVVGSNAAFKDAEKVNASYAEAVDVLAGMKVFQGYPDGSFQPEGSITRAEVAAIVYRLYTGDVADKQASLYATYNKFTDMGGAAWAAGYIGYCANAALVKGYDAKTFGPADKVTGYQALAMILRAVGYDKNDEFTGAQWQLRVASTAQQLGILKNVKGVDLNAPASRELVAELLFRTAAFVPMVTYTPALGYTNLTAILNGKANATLGEKNFGLTKTAASNDKWGRPLYKWTDGKTTVYATIKATPVATYQKAVTECDVAHDAGLKVDTAYTLYVNGDKLNAKYIVNLTDTVTKMGEQGRLIEVYDDTIVMIDTFLAKVTSVSEAAYDAAGHLRKDATIGLKVYDTKVASQNASTTSSLTLTNGKTNYEYAVGDFVLVNAFTTVNTAGGIVNTATTSGTVINNNKADIVGKATSVDGAQSIIYWNAKQHNVEGTVYDDAYKFMLDEAGTDTTKHTWFFDQYNNLIGDVEIAAATSYGVINKIWWAGNAADGSGVAKADVTYVDGTTGQVDISEVTYYGNATPGQAYSSTIDRLTGTVTHSTNYTGALSLMKAVNGYFYVDSYATENARIDSNGILNENLFQFTTKANGTMKAIEVAGNGAAQAEVAASAAGVTPVVYYQSAIPAGFYNDNLKVWKDTQYNGGKLIINTNTVFLIRSGNATTGYTFKSVTGYTNIDNYASAEVDFVDLNGDTFADYVFIKASTEASKVTSLFYYNIDQAYWTAATNTWTIPGYIDGVKGEIYASGYTNAFVSTIKTQTAPTLYKVALADKYVQTSAGLAPVALAVVGTPSAAVDVTAYNAEYKLASVYTGYTPKAISLKGDANKRLNGTVYADGINADPALNKYYSVSGNGTDGITKLVGAFGNVADQNVIFVYNSQSEYDRLMLQGYIVDKNDQYTPFTVLSANVYVTNWATAGVLNGRLDAVAFEAKGFANTTFTGASKDLTATAKWYVREAGQVTFREAVANEVFVHGNTYKAVITLDVPSATYQTVSISPLNTVNYLGNAPTGSGSVVTSGTGVTVESNIFTM